MLAQRGGLVNSLEEGLGDAGGALDARPVVVLWVVVGRTQLDPVALFATSIADVALGRVVIRNIGRLLGTRLGYVLLSAGSRLGQEHDIESGGARVGVHT